MGEQMNFPKTFDEFAEQYKIIDEKEVYTNGTELIPIFRVKQWLTRTIHTVDEHTAKIKAEAYREFAERAIDRVEKAKAKYQRLCKEQGEEMEEHMHIHFNGITKIINNLLKELVGEDDG